MKICIYGAGAVGTYLAGRLHAGGADVSLVARGAHLDAIQKSGMVVRVPDQEIRAEVKASDDPHALGPQDMVIVTVKAPALPSVAAGIAPLLKPETPVAFIMNGVPWWYFYNHGGSLDGQKLPRLDPDNTIWNTVGPERAIGGVISSACHIAAPGIVEVENINGPLFLGEPNNKTSSRLEALAGCFRAGGLDAVMSNNIREEIWIKLARNIGSGPMAVLTQAKLKDLFADEACFDIRKQIQAEMKEIAAAFGCTTKPDTEVQFKMLRSSNHKVSILQDLELGRPMEIDAMFAAPLDLARLKSVPSPILDILVTLAKVRARQAGLYNS